MGSAPFSPADSFVQSADVLLRAGIAAAHSGQRERARDLLVRALNQDRHNALAWLWLSGVVDRPDERRDCLAQVLAIDPDNQAARRGLALLRRQEATRLVQAGIVAARLGQRERARDLLVCALEQDRHNVLAWLWLSSVLDRPDERRDCLRRALALDPGNEAARRGLALLQERPRQQPTPAFVEPVVSSEPRRADRPVARVHRHRVSNGVIALGVLAGAVLLVGGLLLIKPALAAHIANWISPFAPPAEAVASSPATATPTPPDEASSPHTGPADLVPVEANTDITPTERSFPVPTPTPTVSPSATPPPTATPTPIVYPPTRIVIPSIGVDAPVVLADSQITDTGGIVQRVWIVPEASSAGWHEGSATLGTIGNTVINGHNWPQDAIFRDLHLVQPGELITLYSADTPFFYEVAEVLTIHETGQPWEVQQSNTRYIQATADERVTIFTCYPYGSIQNRFIVIARPVEPVPAAESE